MKLLPLLIICLSLTPTVHAELDRERFIYYCEDTVYRCENLKKGDELYGINAGQAVLYCDKEESILRHSTNARGVGTYAHDEFKYTCLYNGRKIKEYKSLRN